MGAVALRKESVDRNFCCNYPLELFEVALRKESVDRNRQNYDCFEWIKASLSARRAWIEIKTRSQPSRPRAVALRKESVDRNSFVVLVFVWFVVALRKESVDRNLADDAHFVTVCESLSARRAWIEIARFARSVCVRPSLSARRAWIEILTDDVSTGGKISRSPQGERG